MTTLTKAVRDETIRSIMRESYAPRFADLMGRITAHVGAEVRAEHPLFYEMLKDEGRRPYLAVQQGLKVSVQEEREGKRVAIYGVRFPTFFGTPEFSALHREQWYKVDYTENIKTGLSHPELHSLVVLDKAHPLAAEYDALWATFEQAWNTVTSTLYSYNVRERFEADFPELAKHLPAQPVKTKALAVPVADIRAKLAAAGIPPTPQGA